MDLGNAWIGERRDMRSKLSGATKACDWAASMQACAVAVALSLTGCFSAADEATGSCVGTANALLNACESEALHDFWLAVAKCKNIASDSEREQCMAEAREARAEAVRTCREQLAARRSLCELVGAGRYDPQVDPAAFDDDFGDPTNPNRYYPLKIGNLWVYHGGGEHGTLEVLDKTKLIDGVTCVVVSDKVREEGSLVEDTDDWFALAKSGDVWYFGEEVKNYESFEGDDPGEPELVSMDGSFKAGRDWDKPGIIFKASPETGEVYREEFSLGNAEDLTIVLSTTYGYGADAELDRFVPRPLADLLCSGDCIVTENFSPLEPGIIARKYYARDIGFFLEVKPVTGEVLKLVDCNFDPRCATIARAAAEDGLE